MLLFCFDSMSGKGDSGGSVVVAISPASAIED